MEMCCVHTLKQAVIAASDGAIAAISAEVAARKSQYRTDWGVNLAGFRIENSRVSITIHTEYFTDE